MKTDKKQPIIVSPRITQASRDFYAQQWGNANKGAEYLLNAFPRLYAEAEEKLRGIFTQADLDFIGRRVLYLSPEFPGEQLPAMIDGEIYKKAQALTRFERACLEILLLKEGKS